MSRRENFDAGHGNPDYIYRVNHQPGHHTVVIAAKVQDGADPKPVGAFSIDHDYVDGQNDEQEYINEEEGGHSITQDEDGQRRWRDGNMDPPLAPAQVGWLGMDSREAGPSVLANMVSLGIAQFGRLPYADSSLTEDGARISRGMVRKYGMKPHPDNPEMRPARSLSYPDREEANEAAAKHASIYWNHMLPNDNQEIRTYTHAEASKIHQGVDNDYRLSKQKPETPSGMTDDEWDEHWTAEQGRKPGRGQMKLF